MPDKVTLTFNGREIETEAGKPIIALSQELGEEIPHFCYHPGIGVDGNCRMCLVELAGAPKLVAGCTLKAAEGMNITSNSEQVIKAREGVLEFILINHPLDCPICDKGGECPLQDVTREHGPAHGRMADTKNRNLKHQVIGEHIIFDAERCILCSRCLRYQRDIVGREELGIRMRGDKATISLFGDRQLTSGFTGNLADICPVGALTSREFRFQARPWELRPVATSCGGCSLGCAMRAWWKGEDVMRVTAEPDPAVNAWWICDRGRYEYLNAPGQAENLVQRQGVPVPVDRSEATARALELLSGGKAAVLAGSRVTNAELAALARLNDRLGSGHSPFPAAPALAGRLAALSASGLELEDLAGLERFSRVFVLGEDPELGHPLLGLRLAGLGGAAEVTLVHDGDFAPVSDVTRRWRRVRSEPAAWLADAAAAALDGDDALLLVLTEPLLQAGAPDDALLARLKGRGGACRVLILLDGMNRRGLLEAAAALKPAAQGLLAALEAEQVERLLVFGLDPDADLADRGRWERAMGRAGSLILQSAGMESLHAAAAVVLARRRPVDLEGTMSNTWGGERTLSSWRATAGDRSPDSDWFAPLLDGDGPVSDTLEVAGSHEG